MTQRQLSMRTPQGWVSLLLLIAFFAIIGYWASRLLAPAVAIAPVVVSAAPTNNSLSANGQRLFGQPAPAAAPATAIVPDSQIQVAGIMVNASGRAQGSARIDNRSVALLAVDGKPPKPFSIGQTISTGVTLTRVSAQEVVVTRNGAEVKLVPPKMSDMSVLTAGKAAATSQSTYPPTPAPTVNNFTPPPAPAATAPAMAPSAPAQMQPPPTSNQPNNGQPVAETGSAAAQDGSQAPTMGGSMRGGSPR